MKIDNINIDTIIHYNKNTKKHPDDQINKIAASIKEFGFNVPVLLDKDNVIIAEQLNRRCYIMEFEPIYCQVIINRWQKLTGKTAEKII